MWSLCPDMVLMDEVPQKLKNFNMYTALFGL